MLPKEIWNQIVFYLPLKERCKTIRVSKTLKKIVQPYTIKQVGHFEIPENATLGNVVYFKERKAFYISFGADIKSKNGVQIHESIWNDEGKKYETTFLQELPSTFTYKLYIKNNNLIVEVYEEAGSNSFNERLEKFGTNQFSKPKIGRLNQIDSKHQKPKLNGGFRKIYEIDIDKKSFKEIKSKIYYSSRTDRSLVEDFEKFDDQNEFDYDRNEFEIFDNFKLSMNNQKKTKLNKIKNPGTKINEPRVKIHQFNENGIEQEIKTVGESPIKLMISNFPIYKKKTSIFTLGFSDEYFDETEGLNQQNPKQTPPNTFVKFKSHLNMKLMDYRFYPENLTCLYEYDFKENIWSCYFLNGLHSLFETQKCFRGKYSHNIDGAMIIFSSENEKNNIKIYQIKL
eukprot:gene400-6814_t